MNAFRPVAIAVVLLGLGVADAQAQQPRVNNPLQPNLGVPYSNNSPRMKAARQMLARQMQRRRRGGRRTPPRVMNYGATAPRPPF